MKKMTIKLRTVTPLFIAGADPEIDTEIRELSIKGMLRFCYRAVHPGYSREDEDRIFGSTDKRSAVTLRITDRPSSPTDKKGDVFNKYATYLGYGVIMRDKDSKKLEAVRPYFKEGTTLTLNLMFHSLSDNELKSVERSLWA